MRRLAIAGFFFAATAIFTYPLGTRMGTDALDLGADTRLFLWTLGWDAHAIAHEPLGIFDANIFYPERLTLAYSEHQIGSALIAAPIIWTSGNLVLAMNAVALFSCFLSGLGAYYLGREIGLGPLGALTCGVVFAFTPPRFFRLGQLHLATVQWIPFCLAFLHRYARGGSRRHLMGAVLAFSLQALSGGQSALFLALAATGLLVYLAIFSELRPRSSLARDTVLGLLLAAALNVPFALPYFAVKRELGLERKLDEAVFWSPNAASFLASPTHVDRWLARAAGLERRIEREAKAYLFPGILPLLLALVSVLVPGKRRKNGMAGKESSPDGRAPKLPLSLRLLDGAIALIVLAGLGIAASGGVSWSFGGIRLSASGGERAALLALVLVAVRIGKFGTAPFALAPPLVRLRDRLRAFLEPRFGMPGGFYLFLAVFSLWVSLGPQAVLYSGLYRLLPGFDFIRVPSRFTLLTVLALAVLAGMGAERIALLASPFGRLAIPLLGITLVELAAFPLPTTPYPVLISPMDRFLAGASPGPVAAFPVPDPRDPVRSARRNSLYMLESTVHFLPLVNGYSGFTPPFHDALFRALAAFPEGDGLGRLEQLGVRYAVFHRDGYDERGWQTLLERLQSAPDRLSLAAEFDEGRVYELLRRRTITPESTRSCIVRSFTNLEALRSARCLNVDLVAFFFAEEGAADGRSGGDVALGDVGLLAHDELVDDFLLFVLVVERDLGSERYFPFGNPVEVHHREIGESLSQLPQPGVDVALPLLGGVVLGILRQSPCSLATLSARGSST